MPDPAPKPPWWQGVHWSVIGAALLLFVQSLRPAPAPPKPAPDPAVTKVEVSGTVAVNGVTPAPAPAPAPAAAPIPAVYEAAKEHFEGIVSDFQRLAAGSTTSPVGEEFSYLLRAHGYRHQKLAAQLQVTVDKVKLNPGGTTDKAGQQVLADVARSLLAAMRDASR